MKHRLNEFIQIKAKVAKSSGNPDRVVYLKGDFGKEMRFENDRLTIMLSNFEEDRDHRTGNPWMAEDSDGAKYPVAPEIRMNLYVLFVANWNDYHQSMKFLSLAIRFFQVNHVFTRQNSPGMGKDLEKLWIELVTMPFAQQNEVWNALRTTYHPSVLYKVKTVGYSDYDAIQYSPQVNTPGKEKEQGN